MLSHEGKRWEGDILSPSYSFAHSMRLKLVATSNTDTDQNNFEYGHFLRSERCRRKDRFLGKFSGKPSDRLKSDPSVSMYHL